jgi:hypothetical protein
MKTTDAHNQKIAKLTFASVYPMYIKCVSNVYQKSRNERQNKRRIAPGY